MGLRLGENNMTILNIMCTLDKHKIYRDLFDSPRTSNC